MSAYSVAAEAMDLEVYILAALFCGSHGLHAIEADHQGLRWVRSTFEASEVSRRVISLAVVLRSHLDSSNTKSTVSVGSLLPDVSKPGTRTALLLREACNKIIHADIVDLNDPADSSEEVPRLSRRIQLQGSWSGKDWHAEIDVLAFLNEASKHS